MGENFSLNPSILQTATGSISGDIDQLQNAVYGREVRASIAEALYLLYQNSIDHETKLESCLQQLGQYTEIAKKITTDLLTIKRRLGMLEYPFPDVNGDGLATAEDAQLMTEFSAKVSAGDYADYDTVEEKWNAFAAEKGLENSHYISDINGDGELKADDSVYVLGFATESGSGNYPNTAEGFREYMLDNHNAIFGANISGIRAVTQEDYDRLDKKPGIMYVIQEEQP